MASLGVELVKGDVSCSDENFLNKWVDSLENGEIEKLGALLVQIWH